MWYFKLPISRLQDFTRFYDMTSHRILKQGPCCCLCLLCICSHTTRDGSKGVWDFYRLWNFCSNPLIYIQECTSCKIHVVCYIHQWYLWLSWTRRYTPEVPVAFILFLHIQIPTGSHTKIISRSWYKQTFNLFGTGEALMGYWSRP